ncbi:MULTISPECIES: hypothetical protein [Vibrio]|uniref:Lipoprotein n=2 Tax=Vibrio TaxID=662 RepID=A0A1E5D0H7_9VIBR|nr:MULTISPECIES: hypothetical protein [Vibrio]RBW64816.1 hypothetical protein DS893_14165 [Vibrionales bacterium C3R12]MDN3697360.1 hypothetical protein [Vibrio cortegadensis]NOH82530.1 hypothetical protein [Vibrio sp. 03-59-1]OEE76850.1 hypothetical protein A130_04665 [Vibrio genomosp. F6 str. FF-238]TKF21477.1 hypothetical protein FCV43_09075 [Vibrio genomosp. F6]
MNIKPSLSLSLLSLAALLLSGCSEEKIERLENAQTYAFKGMYSNQENSNTIHFKDGVMRYTMAGEVMEKPYTVEDKSVYIKLRNSSKEKRNDLVMSIHLSGARLTCNSCAMYNMSSLWLRAD